MSGSTALGNVSECLAQHQPFSHFLQTRDLISNPINARTRRLTHLFDPDLASLSVSDDMIKPSDWEDTSDKLCESKFEFKGAVKR